VEDRVSSSRSQTIEALETTGRCLEAMLARGVRINQYIHVHKLPVPALDLTGIHTTLQAVEVMLREMELRVVA
jgi:hypothetical protein